MSHGISDYTNKGCRCVICKAAAANYKRKQRKKHPKTFKNAKLKRQFGITFEDYEKLLQRQNGVCAICGYPPKLTRMLAVDHIHRTGKIRSLLCTRCNLGLGWYEQNQKVVNAYLRRYGSENE